MGENPLQSKRRDRDIGKLPQRSRCRTDFAQISGKIGGVDTQSADRRLHNRFAGAKLAAKIGNSRMGVPGAG